METTESKLEEVTSILLVIADSNEDSEIIAALDILMKLVMNVLKSPQEEKFRKIKKTNKTIAHKLLAAGGIEDLLLAIGYKDISDEFYEFDMENYNLLVKSKRHIEELYDERRKKYMTQDELIKFEVLQEQKRIHIEEYKKRKAAKDSLESGMKLDRVEKSKEITKASKGNQLNFGANLVKFTPSAPASGG
jgi:hypothetical protein